MNISAVWPSNLGAGLWSLSPPFSLGSEPRRARAREPDVRGQQVTSTLLPTLQILVLQPRPSMLSTREHERPCSPPPRHAFGQSLVTVVVSPLSALAASPRVSAKGRSVAEACAIRTLMRRPRVATAPHVYAAVPLRSGVLPCSTHR